METSLANPASTCTKQGTNSFINLLLFGRERHNFMTISNSELLFGDLNRYLEHDKMIRDHSLFMPQVGTEDKCLFGQISLLPKLFGLQK